MVISCYTFNNKFRTIKENAINGEIILKTTVSYQSP